MPKLVSLTRERRSENWTQTDFFVAANHVENPEQAIREAVKDYLQTPDGKRMIDYSGGDYNWGDALASVTDEFWEKHGIQIKYDNQTYTLSGSTIEITVNQDEVLCNHIFEEEE